MVQWDKMVQKGSGMTYDIFPPNNFLGLEEANTTYDNSAALILPLPYEGTVSYGQGTRLGPQAIIEASQQVELYDRELDDEPALTHGIHTLPALAPVVRGPEHVVDAIAAYAEEHLHSGKLLVGLGGEHTVSVGMARAVKAIYDDFVLVQIDAHSDFRDSYEGSPYSHASIGRRIFDMGATIVQFGIRSICREEMEFIRAEKERVHVFFAEDVHAGQHVATLPDLLRGRTVFLTIDLDGFDPAYVPATGTPEPNGLSWMQGLEIIRVVTQLSRVIAIDCVELAPIPGQYASNFFAAKLVYKAIGLTLAKRNET
ncbi:MAG: agmatinase [Chloroflexi bacterium AL-W]|nr:agmatinase [Chloroflexi bacterium AL-N1]NOK69137.1 agmatinase [Chloroflexi bacterium AL-N10]NOK77120.1 agmatinase [Chloroflexi bacterium AL-N5]NOK83765.1 agmatinase [Chloroflexi bacterium AL-W]NOK90975.1 agmatinase [Chloroflexi bacterium AL-N15]